jgi:hypothetical protein
MTGWRLQLAILGAALAAVAINLVLGGYQVDYPDNHSHQIPLVLQLWKPDSFPGDPFVATLSKAPHFFWSALAWTLTPDTLDAGLLGGFLVFKILFFFATGSLAAALAWRRRLLAAALAMAAFVDGTALILGGEVLNWTYLTHTQAAQALIVASLAAMAWRKPWLAASAMALAEVVHPLYGALGWAFYLPAAIFADDGTKRLGGLARGRPVACFLLPLLAMAPHLLAAGGRLGGLPEGWADWIAERYAIHHKPELQPWPLHLFPAAASLGLLLTSPILRPSARGMAAGWVAAFWWLCAVGYAGVVAMRHPFFLQLQPFRASGLAVPLMGASLAACLASARRPLGRRGRLNPALPWGLLLLSTHIDVQWLPTSLAVIAALMAQAVALILPKRPRLMGQARKLLETASAFGLAWFAMAIYLALGLLSGPPGSGDLASDSAAAALAIAGSLATAWAAVFGPRRWLRWVGHPAAWALPIIVFWTLRVASLMASEDKSLYERTARPEMRALGAWMRERLPEDAIVAAPHLPEAMGFPSLRGLRAASWRSFAWNEGDEAGVYYDPAFLSESERREGLLGEQPSAAFLRGQSVAWLEGALALGATHLVLPSLFGPRELTGWRQIHNNGAFRVLERSEEKE